MVNANFSAAVTPAYERTRACEAFTGNREEVEYRETPNWLEILALFVTARPRFNVNASSYIAETNHRVTRRRVHESFVYGVTAVPFMRPFSFYQKCTYTFVALYE